MDEMARQASSQWAAVDGDLPGAQKAIERPAQTRDLKPHHPGGGLAAQGVVVLEAHVAPSGCVHKLLLRRGVNTQLDLEAIRAVSGWGYAQPLLDGKPTPVAMTVAVRFERMVKSPLLPPAAERP